MRTLYLRNVPEETVERLQALAERAGMSVSAFAVRELTQAARRADNAALLADLPSSPAVRVDDVLEVLDEGRAGR